MNRDARARIQRLLRLFLGVLMLWAAISKLVHPADFLDSIHAYQFPLPQFLLRFAAVVLPWVELLCGLLLVAGYWVKPALVLLALLLATFALATGQAWARGLDISCGCFDLTVFGLRENIPGVAHFLESVAFAFFRNVALLALTAFLLCKRRHAERSTRSKTTTP